MKKTECKGEDGITIGIIKEAAKMLVILLTKCLETPHIQDDWNNIDT